MMEIAAVHLSIEMHHDANAPRHTAGDIQFASTDQRNVAEAKFASPGCRKFTVEIVGRSEKDADKRFVANPVAVEHALHKGLRFAIDLVLGVFVAGGRTAQR